MTATERKFNDSTTVMTDAASGLRLSPTCGRPRFSEMASPALLSVRMRSCIRSEEIADIVEWLRPVVAAISVRDGCPARRTAEITIARFRRRKSSWRIPTDMILLSSRSSSRPVPRIQRPSSTLCKYWQKQAVLSLFIPRLEKMWAGSSNPSESMLTAPSCWISIFSGLEKIEPFCRPWSRFGRTARGAGRIQ